MVENVVGGGQSAASKVVKRLQEVYCRRGGCQSMLADESAEFFSFARRRRVDPRVNEKDVSSIFRCLTEAQTKTPELSL